MRSRRHAIGRSVEPCATAASNRIRRPEPRPGPSRLPGPWRAASPWGAPPAWRRPPPKRSIPPPRPAAARAFPTRETPPYSPSVVYGCPQSSSSSSVCERGRAVISTSCPSRSSSSTSGLSTRTWAVLVRSTQIRTRSVLRRPAVFDLEQLLNHHLERGVLDAEAVGELALQSPANLVGVPGGVDAHMGGECREARGDRPHVQVVDFSHS